MKNEGDSLPDKHVDVSARSHERDDARREVAYGHVEHGEVGLLRDSSLGLQQELQTQSANVMIKIAVSFFALDMCTVYIVLK